MFPSGRRLGKGRGQVPGAAPPDHFIQKTAAACDAAGLVLYLNR